MTRSLILILAAFGLVFAQSQPPSGGGWRRAGDRPPETAKAPGAQIAQGQDPEPVDRSDSFGQAVQEPQGPEGPQQPQAAMNRLAYGLPAEVTLRPGTYMTVRIG